MESRPQKLLDQVREAIRIKHYSYCTEESYVAWIRRFSLFHHKRHPRDMGTAEVTAFLSHLAIESALLFLYRTVLQQELEGGWFSSQGSTSLWCKRCTAVGYALQKAYLDLAPAKKPGFWRKSRRETLNLWLRNPVSVSLLRMVQMSAYTCGSKILILLNGRLQCGMPKSRKTE